MQILSGHCHTEQYSATEETAPTFHNRCAGAYESPNKELTICPCPQHEGETRCRLCRHDHTNPDEYDAHTRRCTDIDACEARTNKGRPALTAVEGGKKQKTERVPRAARAPRECECECGGMTKGGRFQPGHDAKMKGRLIKAAKEGDTAAADLLREKGWAK